MKWIEAKVIFDFEDKQLATDLIANAFYELGLKGVVVEDPDAEQPSEDWSKNAIKAEHYGVIGYFPKNEESEIICKLLAKNMEKLENDSGIRCRIVYSDMDDVDWAESWKAYFQPKKISANIVVKPVWCDYLRGQDEIILEIDPGMAFGTGTHPTTRMCIKMIEKYMQKGNSFLDVGTGSGILMIAAAKFGAGKVLGTDNDKVAVDIARKNLMQNNIAKKVFKLISGNLICNVTEEFDLIAANITSELILILLDDIKRVLAIGGIFICSGITQEEKNMVTGQIKSMGFEIVELLTKDDWVSFACRL